MLDSAGSCWLLDQLVLVYSHLLLLVSAGTVSWSTDQLVLVYSGLVMMSVGTLALVNSILVSVR